jgi:hypothetical protein
MCFFKSTASFFQCRVFLQFGVAYPRFTYAGFERRPLYYGLDLFLRWLPSLTTFFFLKVLVFVVAL